MSQRILMTTDTVGGVWTYSLELCRALGRHGVEIALATMGRRLDAAQASEAAALPNVQIHESTYRLEWQAEPWSDVDRAAEWLLALEQQVAPDTVHLNGYCHASLPFTAPVLVAGHSCVLSWWGAVKGVAAPPEWERYYQRVGWGLRAADLVVAPTGAMLRSLEELYGPFQYTRVLPNGRQPESFPPLPKEPWVVSAGRLWDPAKNVETLARVAPRLSYEVLVAGDAESPDGNEALPANVRRLGRLSTSEMATLLGQAAIYALPARYEPFGLSVLEAALAGCALVIGDIETLRELWDGCALFVPPNDEEALAAALDGLIHDAVQRRRLVRKSRERALEFSPERMAEGYLQAYREAGAPRHRAVLPAPRPYQERFAS